MFYNNKELGLYGFDLNDEDSVKILLDKGLNIDEIKLSLIKDDFVQSISTYINEVAISKGYENAVSFATYASGTDNYALEAQKFISFRSAVWNFAFEQFQKFASGEITLPTKEYFVSTLPKFKDF